MKIPTAYCEFQPVEEVLVGSCFPPTLFEKSKGLAPKTKYLIRKLLEETEEDYQTLEQLLQSAGVKTYRAELDIDNFKIHQANAYGTHANSEFALPFLLQAESASTSVYVQGIIGDGTPTYTNTDSIQLILHIAY